MSRRLACLAALFVLAACVQGGTQPERRGVDVELSTESPLRGEVRFEAGDDPTPRVEITDGEGRGFAVTPPASVRGRVPILGVRPDTRYTVTVHAGGQTQTQPFRTGSLPGGVPPIETTGEANGLTLFDASPLANPIYSGHLVVVDEQGRVVWYYRQPHSIQDSHRTSEGDFLFIHYETGVRRLDPATGDMTEYSGTTGLDDVPVDGNGRAYAGPDAVRVETPQMHHEVIELPNGNLMTLSRENREVEELPDDICEEGPDVSELVTTDVVVEFEPDTGKVVSEWSLFDVLDPLEDADLIRPEIFCSQYLDPVYPDLDARDWTHANAVVLDEARNVVWVSVRHLNRLVALRYASDSAGPAGELVWTLGEGGDFQLQEGEWFLYQHAPQVLEDGRILLYDNGNYREGTSVDDPDHLPYSRAVIYELDTEAMTARQLWENRLDSPGEPVYAPFVGDADLLDGSVLITHGGLTDPPADSPRQEGVTVFGRVVEVGYPDGDPIFDLRVRDERGENWRIYRAERIPTLYPPEFTVEPIEP